MLHLCLTSHCFALLPSTSDPQLKPELILLHHWGALLPWCFSSFLPPNLPYVNSIILVKYKLQQLPEKGVYGM